MDLHSGNVRASAIETMLGFRGDRGSRLRKYGHYVFILSVLAVVLCVLALLNGYFPFSGSYSYSVGQAGAMAGYLGMVVTVAFLPVPDYILVPVYGYLAFEGVFNPFVTFVACLAGSMLLMTVEYVGGRFVGRPLLLRLLSHVRISEKDIEVAEGWLVKHGKFSIFLSTWVPYFYSVTSLAAGMLKMKPVGFFLASAAGFGLRFAFLEYVGYAGIYVSPRPSATHRGSCSSPSWSHARFMRLCMPLGCCGPASSLVIVLCGRLMQGLPCLHKSSEEEGRSKLQEPEEEPRAISSRTALTLSSMRLFLSRPSSTLRVKSTLFAP